jgi:hypothetical protein
MILEVIYFFKYFQDCRFSLRSKRLPTQAGLPKPFQLFFRIAGFISLRRLPSELGLPKPFQQNAAHFVGFFNAQAFTS